MRFVIHLKFFTHRIVRNKQYDDYQDGLLEIIARKYQTTDPCTEEIKKYILKQYKYHLCQEEPTFLKMLANIFVPLIHAIIASGFLMGINEVTISNAKVVADAQQIVVRSFWCSS